MRVSTMTRTFTMLSLVLLTALPSCTHPLDRVLEERAAMRQSSLEAHGQVSNGACDDVGQMIAQQRAAGLSVVTEASAAPIK